MTADQVSDQSKIDILFSSGFRRSTTHETDPYVKFRLMLLGYLGQNLVTHTLTPYDATLVSYLNIYNQLSLFIRHLRSY